MTLTKKIAAVALLAATTFGGAAHAGLAEQYQQQQQNQSDTKERCLKTWAQAEWVRPGNYGRDRLYVHPGNFQLVHVSAEWNGDWCRIPDSKWWWGPVGTETTSISKNGYRTVRLYVVEGDELISYLEVFNPDGRSTGIHREVIATRVEK